MLQDNGEFDITHTDTQTRYHVHVEHTETLHTHHTHAHNRDITHIIRSGKFK